MTRGGVVVIVTIELSMVGSRECCPVTPSIFAAHMYRNPLAYLNSNARQGGSF